MKVYIVDGCGSEHWPEAQVGGVIEVWEVENLDFIEEREDLLGAEDEVRKRGRLVETIYPECILIE